MIPPTVALINRGIYKPAEFITHVVDYHEADGESIEKSDNYIKGVITF
ncbi:MAG: hypothetical protein LBD78_06265 [Spirochaetaceae bacterium]|nr:hypothetical protein [Spirochaetaceae bacterium]